MLNRYGIALLLILSLLTGCASRERWTDEELRQLHQFYLAKDFFALKERLGSDSSRDSGPVSFYRAAVHAAFNEPEASIECLKRVRSADDVSDPIRAEAGTMLVNDYLRLHLYRQALEASDKLLQLPHLPEEQVRDAQNTRRIADALREIPPQRAYKRADTKLRLDGTHLQVTINDHHRSYAYDTGANYSVVMESEARQLGLKIIRADVEVGTSTGGRVKGNIGVAESLSIGNIDYRNVVFLIFPDEALTFPGGFQLKGLIGFPVLEAMGELEIRKDHTIVIPKVTPKRDVHNMALNNLTPLIQFYFGSTPLVGMLDTGAGQSVFYEPFFRRFYADSNQTGRVDTIRTGSVGGIRTLPAFRVGTVALGIAEKTVPLANAYALMQQLDSTNTNYLHACIGLDILNQFDGFILNFEQMSFLLK